MAAMPTLDQLRARVDERRAAGGAPLALALVELGEVEPGFKYRTAKPRALLHEAAALLDREGDPRLRGRLLVRLATLKLADEDAEGTEQLIDRAFDLLQPVGATAELVEAGATVCRARLRRNLLEGVEGMLGRLGATLDATVDDEATRRAAMALALALAELAVTDEAERPRDLARARAILGDALKGLGGDDQHLDARFAGHQLLALLDREDNLSRSCHHLREVLALAKAQGAVQEEVEARLGLAGALVERGDLAGREEAERHLQIARDASLEAGLDSLHMAALVGQAGLMAKKGQTQGALDRCLEIAQAAVVKQDLPRYLAAVALMAEIYKQNGDFKSAYRALAESDRSLVERFGEGARDLLRPHLFALADEMGRERFVAMVEDIRRAEAAREEFDRR